MAEMNISVKHIQRNDTRDNWLLSNPVLSLGELGVETDTFKIKIGNGVDNYADLPYLVTEGDDFIQDVDVAETPQEVIIYNSSIIDDKVTNHDADKTAHADIRWLIDNNVMARYGTVTEEVLNNANYRTPYTTTIDGTKALAIGLASDYHNIIYQPNVDSNGYGTQIAVRFHTGKIFTRGSSGNTWNAWQEFVTTDVTTAIENKVGVLSNDRGYLQSILTIDCNNATKNGMYYVDNTSTNKPLNTSYGSLFVVARAYNRCSQIFIENLGNGKMYTRSYFNDAWSDWKEIATTDNTLSNLYTNLTRETSDATQAIYTIPHDIVHGYTYQFRTGASPSGTVETIIFRTPQGDYTLKVADTNVVDTMSNATWDCFNAGTQVSVYFAERNTIKGAVITNASYGAIKRKKQYLTLLNGWENYSSTPTGGFIQTQVAKSGDIVQLTGFIRKGAQVAETVITTLPTQYRPIATIVTYITDGTYIARIDIRTNGEVRFVSGNGTLQWIDLSQISFVV